MFLMSRNILYVGLLFALSISLNGCAPFKPYQVTPIISSPPLKVHIDTKDTVFAGYAFNDTNMEQARNIYKSVTFESLRHVFEEHEIEARLEHVEKPSKEGLVLTISLNLIDAASAGGNIATMMGFGGGPKAKVKVSLFNGAEELIDESYGFEGVSTVPYFLLDDLSENEKLVNNPGTAALQEALDSFAYEVEDSLD